MGAFRAKKRIPLVLLLALFVGFCIGVSIQRAGIPGQVKRLVFKSKHVSDLPITVVAEVEPKAPPTVWLRKFPYPFKAALAIASDIDSCSARDFEEIHRFLNTTEMTAMGPGLGLDVADSMWMYDISDVHPYGEPPAMSYWQGIESGVTKDGERI